MDRSDDTVEIPALGRPFQLGMLYDCRKDALIPGITLWDHDSLQKDLCIKPQPKTEYEIIASDSIDAKASALNVSGSLKASFLGGLVEVEGSAKYLKDTKKSKQQARVTLQYKATTKYSQLTMSHLGIQNVTYPEVFDHGTATHVVTAILYGAQAFFVFDRNVSSSESVQDIQGSLKVMTEKMVTIEGEAVLKMNDQERNHANQFNCKFYGDFSLESNPVTFQDAMKVYSDLAQKIGEDGDKAVPVRVWLYPLTKLDSKAAKMVREISLALIYDAQTIMEQLSEIDMRCNDLATNPIATTFPEIKLKIKGFQDFCKQHRQIFQQALAGNLPLIRGGGKEERVLVEILTSINQSPFNSKRLKEFLDTKEQEINMVKSYLDILSGIETISSQNKLEEVVLNHQNEFVVSFTFTSLHDEEPFLTSLQHFLHKRSADPTGVQNAPEDWNAWFQEKDRQRNARKAAKSIANFARVNKSNRKTRFLVASVPDQDNPGASIYLYEDGEMVNSNFELPSKPLPPLIGQIGHDHVQLTFQPAEYGRAAISSYQVEYKIAGEENWKIVNTDDSQETFQVRGLSANTEYQFRYTARSKPGLCETSNVSKSVQTLPTSPPGKLRVIIAASSKISIAWESPKIIGQGAVIKEYKVDYSEEAGEAKRKEKDEWAEKRTGKKTEFCEIDGLKPQTPYRFRVSAMCAGGAESEPSKEIEVSTLLEGEENRVACKYLQDSILVEDVEPIPDVSASCITYQLGSEKRNLNEDLRIVLVGKTGGGRSATGNTILGEKKFESKSSLKPVTQTCRREVRAEKWEGKQVVVIDTPAIFDTCLPEQQNNTEIQKCLSLCEPGPHALVFVTQVGHFTEEDAMVAKRVEEVFGPEATKYMIVLFTRKEDLETESLEEYIGRSGNRVFQDLVRKCQGRCCAFNNRAPREEQELQVKELLMKIKQMMMDNQNKTFLEQFPRGSTRSAAEMKPEEEAVVTDKRGPSEFLEGDKEESELCIVLLGKAGVGKSATGNTLLGREKFHSAFSARPTTQYVEKKSGEFNGQKFSVIDTPPVSSSKSLAQHKQKIEKLCKSSSYVLVFVITVGRFTLEDKKTAKKVKKVFRKKFGKHMLVLFTHKEDLKGESLEKYVEKSEKKALLKLVKDCGNRYFALNNKAAGEEKEEVSELMEKLREMLHGDG